MNASMIGCSKKDTQNAAAEPLAALSPHPSPSAKTATPVMNVAARFDFERTNRPKVPLSVERVLTTIRASGIQVDRERQHLGAPFNAGYCLGSWAGEVALSICEFSSDLDAKNGRASSHVLDSVPNREVIFNGHTSLTLRQPAIKTPETERSAKKMKELFTGLK